MANVMRVVALAILLCGPAGVRAQEASPSASVSGVWYEEGKFDREWGVWFTVDFQINECYGRECSLLIWFYDAQNNPLKDRNGEYFTQDKTQVARQDFKPGFRYAKYTKLGVFYPYNEFHVGPGTHDIRFKAGLFWRDDAGWHSVHQTDFYKYPFTWKIPESGEVTQLDVNYNDEREGKNGVEVSINYSVHGMKGKEGRFTVAFYHGLADLHVLNRHGRESEGAMYYTQEFSPQWDNTDFTKGRYWVPYEEFPLKIGRNAFYFKVWLEGKSANGEWYTLDATSSRAIWVNNGELKLSEVWVVENQRVSADWELTEEDRRSMLTILEGFNKRLYDATDGQIRIARFTIARENGTHDHAQSILRFYRDFKNGDHGDTSGWWKWIPGLVGQMRPFAGGYGTPGRPLDIHIPGEWLKRGDLREFTACTLVHEFFHAALGLYDEYKDKPEADGKVVCEVMCARTETLRRTWNTCIMASNTPLYRELCKSETHATGASVDPLGDADCYTKMQSVIRKSLGRELVIPETPVEGPTNPPAPEFRWP